MHQNVELVRRGYQAFNTADITTLTELFDEKEPAAASPTPRGRRHAARSATVTCH